MSFQKFATLLLFLSLTTSSQSAFGKAEVTKQSIQEHKKMYDVDVEYPVVNGLPNESDVNEQVKSQVTDAVSEFKQGLSQTDKSLLKGTYEVASSNPDVLSIRVVLANSCPPDSRPLITVKHFDMSPESGEAIELAKCFEQNPLGGRNHRVSGGTVNAA